MHHCQPLIPGSLALILAISKWTLDAAAAMIHAHALFYATLMTLLEHDRVHRLTEALLMDDYGEYRCDPRNHRFCAMEALQIPAFIAPQVEILVGGSRGEHGQPSLASLFTPTLLPIGKNSFSTESARLHSATIGGGRGEGGRSGYSPLASVPPSSPSSVSSSALSVYEPPSTSAHPTATSAESVMSSGLTRQLDKITQGNFNFSTVTRKKRTQEENQKIVRMIVDADKRHRELASKLYRSRLEQGEFEGLGTYLTRMEEFLIAVERLGRGSVAPWTLPAFIRKHVRCLRGAREDEEDSRLATLPRMPRLVRYTEKGPHRLAVLATNGTDAREVVTTAPPLALKEQVEGTASSDEDSDGGGEEDDTETALLLVESLRNVHVETVDHVGMPNERKKKKDSRNAHKSEWPLLPPPATDDSEEWERDAGDVADQAESLSSYSEQEKTIEEQLNAVQQSCLEARARLVYEHSHPVSGGLPARASLEGTTRARLEAAWGPQGFRAALTLAAEWHQAAAGRNEPNERPQDGERAYLLACPIPPKRARIVVPSPDDESTDIVEEADTTAISTIDSHRRWLEKMSRMEQNSSSRGGRSDSSTQTDPVAIQPIQEEVVIEHQRIVENEKALVAVEATPNATHDPVPVQRPAPGSCRRKCRRCRPTAPKYSEPAPMEGAAVVQCRTDSQDDSAIPSQSQDMQQRSSQRKRELSEEMRQWIVQTNMYCEARKKILAQSPLPLEEKNMEMVKSLLRSARRPMDNRTSKLWEEFASSNIRMRNLLAEEAAWMAEANERLGYAHPTVAVRREIKRREAEMTNKIDGNARAVRLLSKFKRENIRGARAAEEQRRMNMTAQELWEDMSPVATRARLMRLEEGWNGGGDTNRIPRSIRPDGAEYITPLPFALPYSPRTEELNRRRDDFHRREWRAFDAAEKALDVECLRSGSDTKLEKSERVL